MEDGELEQFKGQFEFHTRRAITEAAPHRAACRYDSADDNEEEELAINNGEFFDLNMLPDQMPQDLYQQNNTNNNQKHSGLINFQHQKDQEPSLRLTKNLRESTQISARENYPLGKPLKPVSYGQNGQVPVKVFGNNLSNINSSSTNIMKLNCTSTNAHGSNSCYNSQKNLRNYKAENCNQTMNGPTYGNNRYSSQNMKGTSDFDEDDEQIDEVDNELEVAEENCGVLENTQSNLNQCARTEIGGKIGMGLNGFGSQLQTEVAFSEIGGAVDTLSQTFRRGSYRYKDRINTIRMQSQETYQREHMIGPSYFTQANNVQIDITYEQEGQDADIDIFERTQNGNIYSQRTRYSQQNCKTKANNKMIYNETQCKNQGDFSELDLGSNNPIVKNRYDNFTNQQKLAQKRWTTQPASEINEVPLHQNNNKQQTMNNNFMNQDYDDLDQLPQQDDDATPKQDLSQMYVDPRSGAHFQYKELIKRLSDMTNSSREKSSSRKTKGNKQRVKQNETEGRIPLKEKTQEIVNQQQQPSSQKKKKFSAIDPSGKMRPYCNSAKPTKKDTKKVQNQQQQQQEQPVLKNNTAHNQQHIPNNLATQTKISKMLLNNQENHFIDKKLKDFQNNNELKSNPSKNMTMTQNKSHQNLHKTSDNKSYNKMYTQQHQNSQQSQINNMKLNSKGSAVSIKMASNAPILHQQSANSLKNQSQLATQQSQVNQQQIIINNIITNNALSSSISSSSTGGGATTTNFALTGGVSNQQILASAGGGTFSSGIKCPSSNLLRTATTAAFTTTTTNKSSAKLTQCNSNKQFNNKETPEATSRQKFRLTGTTLSSNNKRNLNSAGGGTTLSNNSQGNTIQNSHNNMHNVIQQQFGFQDSANKRSQNSEQKDFQNVTNKSHQGISQGQINSGTNTHPSSCPRNNSSNKKVSVQKMMKNQSFLKGSIKDGGLKKHINNEFYNTVLQNLQNGKLGLASIPSGQSQVNITLKSSNPQQIMNAHLTQNVQNHIQPRLSDTKKQSIIGQSSKTTRVSGIGAQNQNIVPNIVQSQPGTITNPPSKPQSRLSQGKKTANHKDYLTGQYNIEGGMSQITNNIKRISDLLQAHQQSPTNNNNHDYNSRKNSNKNIKDEEGINDKSLLSKQSSQVSTNGNGQKFNYFMKINLEQQHQQQQLANQSQLQIKSTQSSQTNLNQHSILLNHQVNKTKQNNHLAANRIALSQASSTINTNRPFSGGNSQTQQYQMEPEKFLQTQVQGRTSQDQANNIQKDMSILQYQNSSAIYQQTQPNMPQQQQQQMQGNYNNSQMYLQTQTSYHPQQINEGDNRQSLQVQHKTVEKKSALTAQQQVLQQKLTQNRNQYLNLKKEEMAQATSKTLNHRYQQAQNHKQNDQQVAHSKKSYLMANIKIPKGNSNNNHHNSNKQQLQQTVNCLTQDAYDRMHLPTEEDDFCNPNSYNGMCTNNLISNTQQQQQYHGNNIGNYPHDQPLMTEVYQINNLMETEGDQYDIYNNISNIGMKPNSSYLVQQQVGSKPHQTVGRYGHSNTSGGGVSKHSVKVKPKHF